MTVSNDHDHLEMMIMIGKHWDGFCTCNGASFTGRMLDCGIPQHRTEAEQERRGA